MTRICVNYSTVYNDTLVAKGLIKMVFDDNFSVSAKAANYETKFKFRAVEKGFVEVVGMPSESLQLRTPSKYVSPKMRLLLDVEDNITVKIIK